MGCAGSSQNKGEETTKKLRKPKAWRHPQPITRTQLKQMREEFWDTAPHYGGQKEFVVELCELFLRAMPQIQNVEPEIWDALQAAAEADLNLAQAIVDSAGVIVSNADMTICYDERGMCARYELPKYVLSEPSNLIRDS
ncbi:ubiquitin domain-containing protein 2-like protein [Cinnamomum micranthum f. kanehirae]|uniref:Ubiquitin domain-containing protein 2-like protein n=1 Tax=Cinnamomum micranthum f. kanehirae TaxID=337451 RepID=A0A3S3N5H0_9MAGN|nr:ubiquitin domain-containing protein 2-like protein [Cinnamomum micranthum f. kanehirae]